MLASNDAPHRFAPPIASVRPTFLRRAIPLAATLLLALPGPADRQVLAQAQADALRPASSGGLPAIDRALARLSTHRRLLMVAAHPDDEDTRLLTLVARAEGGEAAYLSVSRGDGGQNLIGPEVGPGLGLLRSSELQAARAIDGAHQFFTRAYDFGYTTSLDETLRRWPKEMLLEDALRVARRFKPQVLVAVFPPTAQAGHGQHWMSAILAEDLYRNAGAPHAILDAEGSAPWPLQAFYRVAFFNPQGATTRLPLGVIDPYEGRSILQLALESRSQHRCQDMGQEQPIGGADDLLTWVAGGTGAGSPDDLFAGVDTRLRAIAEGVRDAALKASLQKELDAIEAQARSARAELSAVRRGQVVAPLGGLVVGLRRLIGGLDARAADQAQVRELLAEKLTIAQEAYAASADVLVDALTDREKVVAGESLKVRAQLWNAAGRRVENVEVAVRGDVPWTLRGSEPPPAPTGFFNAKVDDDRQLEIEVPAGAAPTVPYFRRQALRGDLYVWDGVPTATRGEPFEAPPLSLGWRFVLDGVPVELEREAVYRYRDQAFGEIRRPLRVVPRVEVGLDRQLWLWSRDEPRRQPLHVTLRANGAGAVRGELQVRTPEGWPAVARQPFELAGGGQLAFTVDVAPPAGELAVGRFAVDVTATVEGSPEVFGQALGLIDYPHVRPAAEPRPARLEIAALDLVLPKVGRIGYVRGASDAAPELLREVGLPVEVLSVATLEEGDLGVYDVIVVGPRAYEVEPALARSNERLLAYARAGGRVVVQYQQYQFTQGKFPPLPLEIKRPHDRVTDETAPMRLLVPDHRFFRRPNALGEADWQGWVQERGLYFGGTWDPGYQPLLAMADPGGAEKEGGLLVAKLGEGEYVYTGLAFFRQLPAGVPGAWRLFLNLLAE